MTERERFQAELDRLAEADQVDMPSGYLEPVDLHALMTSEPPTEEWCVEPVLAARKLTGIVSRRGVGKSLLALDLAARKAAGLPVLDQPAGPPTHVLYLDQEMGPDDLWERLNDLGWTPDHPAFETMAAHLHYYQLVDLPPLDTAEGGEALEELVDQHNAELVVIDTVSRVVEGDENSNDTFQALARHTEIRLRRRGVTLARLDHLGKDATKGSRGASSKEDYVDIVWQLTESAGTLQLTLTKGRQAWLPPVVSLRRTVTNGIVSHEMPDVVAPQWLVDLVYLIDGLGLPADAGVPTVQKALQEKGQGRRRSDIAKAVRFRKGRAKNPGNTPGTPPLEHLSEHPGTPTPETPPDQELFDGNTYRNTREQVEGGWFPPRGGTPPNPNSDTCRCGAEVERFTPAGIAYCETCGPPEPTTTKKETEQ